MVAVTRGRRAFHFYIAIYRVLFMCTMKRLVICSVNIHGCFHIYIYSSSQPVSQPIIHEHSIFSHPARQPARQPDSQTARQPDSQTTRRLVNQSPSQAAIQSAVQPISQPVSLSPRQSVFQSVRTSLLTRTTRQHCSNKSSLYIIVR